MFFHVHSTKLEVWKCSTKNGYAVSIKLQNQYPFSFQMYRASLLKSSRWELRRITTRRPSYFFRQLKNLSVVWFKITIHQVFQKMCSTVSGDSLLERLTGHFNNFINFRSAVAGVILGWSSISSKSLLQKRERFLYPIFKIDPSICRISADVLQPCDGQSPLWAIWRE